MPPVEVPAAMLPLLSKATQPTVPNLESLAAGSRAPELLFSRSMARCSPSQRSCVKKYSGGTVSRPCSLANISAPLPAIITCTEVSMTLRAKRIGFLTMVTPATAPASRVAPFMKEASSSFLPSLVNTAPLPALNSGVSSRKTMVASTASIAEPPVFSTSSPKSRAWFSAAM